MIVQRITVNRAPTTATARGIAYYTVPETAKILRKSTSWIYRQVRSGNLPHHRQGHNIFFTDGDIRDILVAAARPAKKTPAKAAKQQSAVKRTAPKPVEVPAVAPVAPTRHLRSVDDIPTADPTGSRRYRAAGSA